MATQTRKWTQPAAPHSFIYYVVAKIGSHGQYRPLAVVLHQGGIGPSATTGGHQVVYSGLRAIKAFSDTANRKAIQAELSLAREFYKANDESRVPRADPPELDRWRSDPELDAKRKRPWDTSLPQFPFISTTLLVSVGRNAAGEENNARTEPLGTVFRDDSIEYGMVVLDISDLDDISYGIVGFMVCRMSPNMARRRAEELGVPMQRFPPAVEDDRPRKPLSAREYMDKFHQQQVDYPPYGYGDVVQKLQESPLINVTAMDFIWPDGAGEKAAPVIGVQQQETKEASPMSEQAVASLVDSFLAKQCTEASLLDQARKIPHFEEILRAEIRHRFEQKQSPHPEALATLLAIAFAGEQHLDWILLNGLTIATLKTALSTGQLSSATSIGLCIDTVDGTPAELIEALSMSKNLQELYLLQKPDRNNDDQSTQAFLALAASSHRHLLDCKIMLTGAFSAPLRKRFWLPTTNYRNNIPSVRHVFVRNQRGPSLPFWSNYCYLGDALLQPEHFATGFLQLIDSYKLSMHSKRNYTFSSAAPSLSDLSRTQISPIPAENFSIWPMDNHQSDAASSTDCWPKTRDLETGSWVALLSVEKQLSEIIEVYEPRWETSLKYALVRLRLPIVVDKVQSLDLETIEVYDLTGFLTITALEADISLLNQRLEELADSFFKVDPREEPRPKAPSLSVLKPQEACDVLRDFLVDSQRVKRNLVVVMEANPECNWYPELRSEESNRSLGAGI